MVNEAWLFTFSHWTHGYDVNVVKNINKSKSSTNQKNSSYVKKNVNLSGVSLNCIEIWFRKAEKSTKNNSFESYLQQVQQSYTILPRVFKLKNGAIECVSMVVGVN